MDVYMTLRWLSIFVVLIFAMTSSGPLYELEGLDVVRRFLDSLNFFVANNRFDSRVGVVDYQLLDALVRHLHLSRLADATHGAKARACCLRLLAEVHSSGLG